LRKREFFITIYLRIVTVSGKNNEIMQADMRELLDSAAAWLGCAVACVFTGYVDLRSLFNWPVFLEINPGLTGPQRITFLCGLVQQIFKGFIPFLSPSQQR